MIPSRAAREIRTLTRKIVELDRRLAQSEMPGTVAEIDTDRRRLRLDLGMTAAGDPILSPWVRWAEASNGSLRVHSAPVVGTPMILRSPSGTVGDGSIAHWGSYTDDVGAPSTAAAGAMLQVGSSSIAIGPDGLDLTAATIRLHGDVKADGGVLTHDDVNVGKDHPHTNVMSGSDLSGPPA